MDESLFAEDLVVRRSFLEILKDHDLTTWTTDDGTGGLDYYSSCRFCMRSEETLLTDPDLLPCVSDEEKRRQESARDHAANGAARERASAESYRRRQAGEPCEQCGVWHPWETGCY
jgi:hypothetical protein